MPGASRTRSGSWTPGASPARPRRWNLAWLGLATAATAAAAVVVITTTTGSPALVRPHQSPPVASAPMSTQQILLAAATTAQTRSDSGTYWHLKSEYSGRGGKRTFPKRLNETWVGRDGQAWVASEAGDSVYKVKGRKSFLLADNQVTFAQIQQLPTDPEELKAWIFDKIDNGDGDVDPTARDWFAASSLTTLLGELPAPPEVRAAAYRALATMPIVKSTGPANDSLNRPGEGLEISDLGVDMKVIIDPDSSLVLGSSYRSGKDGKIFKEGTTTVLTSEWTDNLPPLVPAPKPTGPARG
ncbi:CU044_5270 family protein [Sphaerisporangium fuscum]|uniref:CU044_5270 family protein n=1 Tax=Sphaerisporangium fuscum TaxID=2835868 RepID=UPI001BDC1480|nr:CU044_5270 family protein [Sphaerisporangium fuscum]